MGADRGLLQTAARAVAGFGVLALLLSGCTDDPEPIISTTPTFAETTSPTPSASASPTPSPSPSATALTEAEVLAQIPEDARNESLAGAVNFAAFALVESQAIVFTRNSVLFEAIASSECEFCEARLETLDAMLAADETANGDDLVVLTESALGGPQADGTWVIDVPVTVPQVDVLSATGEVTRTIEPAQYNARVLLRPTDLAWELSEVSAEAA
ncbi:hypothetical protein [Demequina sp. NBRC 110051]|uniref:hypothetical protein n=1 Tax=Demequina sp. NBRC 110051 TaxID=1570340 RepID=UPI001180B5A6|nr:hypothetical protein [Demequina sp. NBRC 110051]